MRPFYLNNRTLCGGKAFKKGQNLKFFVMRNRFTLKIYLFMRESPRIRSKFKFFRAGRPFYLKNRALYGWKFAKIGRHFKFLCCVAVLT